MSEHVRDGGAVGRELVLRPSEVPLPILAEGTAPITSILAEGTAPYPVVRTEPVGELRRIWPWVTGTIVLAGAIVTAYLLLALRAERVAYEDKFPIVVDARDRESLEGDAERWTHGRPHLLATLARFRPPALDTLTGAGACPLEIDDGIAAPTTDDPDAAASTRMIVSPGESLDGLDVLARDEIDRMVAASERGRFRTDEGKSRMLRAIRGAWVVALINEPTAAAGVAYAFDPATGALRCAGAFRSIPGISSSLRAID